MFKNDVINCVREHLDKWYATGNHQETAIQLVDEYEERIREDERAKTIADIQNIIKADEKLRKQIEGILAEGKEKAVWRFVEYLADYTYFYMNQPTLEELIPILADNFLKGIETEHKDIAHLHDDDTKAMIKDFVKFIDKHTYYNYDICLDDTITNLAEEFLKGDKE